MQRFNENYRENVALFERTLHTAENFDVIKKVLRVGEDEITLFYIDGMIKDGAMQKLFIYLLGLTSLPQGATEFLESNMPYVESEVTANTDLMLQMVLSGATLLLGSTFGAEAVLVDARTYPARETAEPENDRVMRGPRDGFVETLVFNTALIRRRIRDAGLTMHYTAVGQASKTDIVVAYMRDRADKRLVCRIKNKLASLETDALSMGHESLAEALIKTRWYNPFPKIR